VTDNTRHLIQAAASRRAATIARAQDTIARLDRSGQPVTFRSVATQGAVSRSWLYREPTIRAEIERLRTLQPDTQRIPAAQRTTPDSARHRLEVVQEEVHRLREENRQLRDQLARRLGRERTSAT
jgi:hypothetical protein